MKKKREGKFGKRYDDAFKAEAIKLCRTSDKSVYEVAKLLGVSSPGLKKWLLQAAVDEAGGRASALTTDERRELRQLRRELDDLKTANTILKKAVAFSERKKR